MLQNKDKYLLEGSIEGIGKVVLRVTTPSQFKRYRLSHSGSLVSSMITQPFCRPPLIGAITAWVSGLYDHTMLEVLIFNLLVDIWHIELKE